MSKNDEAWARLFGLTRTLEEVEANGYCYISADDLKNVGKREPRLMAKLDTHSVCPKVFRDNRLTIFPVRNGEYIIFRDPENKSYFKFSSHDYERQPEVHHPGIDLSTFDSYPGSQQLNESQAIDFAHLTSLLQRFTGESDLYLTIRGRLYSGNFSFELPSSNHAVNVTGVQIEVDAGYESRSTIHLIEAKVGRREDFHIRQLYYPYLEWSRKSHKRIVPIFLAYTNGKYFLTEFEFASSFGELRIADHGCYVISESPIANVDLGQLLANTSEGSEPNVPYPQANDLDKVIDLVSAVGNGTNNKVLIAEYFEFDERQGDYYANAALYLGFVRRSGHEFVLTELGTQLIRTKSLQSRTHMMLVQIAKRPTLRRVLHLLLARDFRLDSISNAEIADIIDRFTDLSGTTPGRRASTVRSWLAWILENSAIQS